MKKKILSLILVLAMVLPLCPVFEVPAFAEGVVSALTSEENKGEEDQSELKIETIPQTSQLATASTSKIVLGTDGKITRAEWLHNLVYVFNMTAEATALPDNYFSDLDNSHKYYGDILLAVEFGVVDVEAGGLLAPDAFVTREYAASTLNFCLGYQLEEDVTYTFSDTADCEDLASTQIALNHGWFELVDGKFFPAILVTEEEVKTMMADATSVLEGQIVDSGYESKYEFAEGVIVIPSGTAVTEKDGIVSITDCPKDISVGDSFAVYFNGIPTVYQAQSVSEMDGVTVISTEAVAIEEAFTSVDAQGVIGSGAMEIIPCEGVNVTLEGASGASTYSIKPIQSSIKADAKVTFEDGASAKVSAKIKNPSVEYIVNYDYVYVALQGDAEITYGAEVDLLDAAELTKSVDLFECSVGGIGSFTISVEFSLSGSISGVVKGRLVAGLECTKENGFRAIKNFTQSDYETNAELSGSVGLKTTLGVTKLKFIEAYIYAEIGAKANLKTTNYYDNQKPEYCTHFSAYLYGKYGAKAGVKFDFWSTSFSVNCDVFTEKNSPVKIQHHYENKKMVPSCSRDKDVVKYFTDSSSKWHESSWINSDSVYVLNSSGESVPLYTYSLNGEFATVTKYNGSAWSVHIPSSIDGYPVTEIADSAFHKNSSIGYVVIPDGVKTIGSYAFYQCSALSEVLFPDTLTTIKERAFSCCAFTSVTIPDSVTTIEQEAFYKCTTLSELYLSKSIVTMRFRAFANTAISSIYIPKSLTVADQCFSGCEDLKNATFENGVEKIVDYLFYDSGIETVKFPDSVTSIGSSVFYRCDSLASVTIPDSVTKIGQYAFYGCSALGSIIIPEGVTMLYNYTFSGCSSLTSVTMPDSLTYIGSSVFSGCRSLKSIDLPKNLETLLGAVFENTAIEYMYIPKTLRDCSSRGSGTSSLEYQGKNYYVYAGPFYGCETLKEIEFQKGITEIPQYLFAGCLALEKMSIPDTVVTIGKHAFDDCLALREILIPYNVTSIGDYAFEQCISLTSITIPDSVTSIGEDAFRNCTSLSELNLSKSIVTMSHWAFANTAISSIYIPKSLTVASECFYGCENLKNVTFENGVEKIVSRLFYNSGIETVEIPDSVTFIGNRAFNACSSLSSVTIPDSVTTIGDSAFSGCEKLEKIQLPENLTSISNNLFSGCTSLKKVDISKLTNLKTIDQYAFHNCDSLETIAFPKSIQTVGVYAFMDCDALKEVSFADYSLKEINACVFKDCPALVSIVLPKGLTTIGSQAFVNDPELVNVTVPESVTSIDSTALSYPDKTTIYGKKGSYAETFANKNGFTFAERYIPLEGMILKEDSEEVVLEQGEYYRAEFEIFPEDSTEVITLAASNSNVTVDGHKLYGRYAGDTVITASTQSGLTYEFSVRVRSVQNIQITNNPTKTSYLMGEEFDKSGMVVQVNYNDGTSKIVEDYTITGFDSSKEGTVTLTIKWVAANGSSYSKTLTITVIDPSPKLTGIYIETLPTKLRYNLREKLDTTGMVVMGTYTDGSTKAITDFTVSGYNALKAGRQTITVTSGNFTTSFTVAVGITITGISIKSLPSKIEYFIGDELDSTGLSLTLTYSDGETETITKGFTLSGFDSETVGKQTITVAYGGCETTFTVTILHNHAYDNVCDTTCNICGETRTVPHVYDDAKDLTCNVCGHERPPYIPGDVDGVEGVTMDDAIYLLFNINFPGSYPVDQPLDFDGNGKEDMDDAIYLLFHVNFPASYPLH